VSGRFRRQTGQRQPDSHGQRQNKCPEQTHVVARKTAPQRDAKAFADAVVFRKEAVRLAVRELFHKSFFRIFAPSENLTVREGVPKVI
jgi:hypothetical protein